MDAETKRIALYNIALMLLYVIVGACIMYTGRSGELSLIHSGGSDFMYSGHQDSSTWLWYHSIRERGALILLYLWVIHVLVLLVLAIIQKVKRHLLKPYIVSALSVFLIEIVVLFLLFGACYDSCI